MEQGVNKTAKIILENEVYEFNIENGKSLYFELQNIEDEIHIKKKQYNNLYSNGNTRVQFNNDKSIDLPMDYFVETDHKSSIHGVLEGLETVQITEKNEDSNNNDIVIENVNDNEFNETNQSIENINSSSNDQIDVGSQVTNEKKEPIVGETTKEIEISNITNSEKSSENPFTNPDVFKNIFSNKDDEDNDLDDYDEDEDELQF
ncbi:hypothetical protein [Mammaliicoccus vitulinus]|uniref:hypothetical protein n=1 Tax=Mammaliicoccus vitulinus TaxID=71237 RepID=UPI00248AE7C2|nr:hypothetical protein [Mammaliicoccus vitulinus]